MTRHRGKRIGDLRLRRAGYKVGAHQVAGVKRKRYFALFGNAAHDVAFGNDSDQIAARIGDHNRANTPIGQNDCDVADCGGGQDGNDFAALEVEDILDIHMNFLPLCVDGHAVPHNLTQQCLSPILRLRLTVICALCRVCGSYDRQRRTGGLRG